MNLPFLLSPAAKDYLWGGTRLNDDFEKNIDVYPLAETWECSTHPDGVSVVASGENSGRLLVDVLKEHPSYVGRHISENPDIPAGELPILIKLIDAKENLSVQVHPDDAYAKEHENGALGKTEMWYVINAAKEARLIYGFRRTIDKEQIIKSVDNGSIEKYLQKVEIHDGDVFFIEPGTVHAIGAGALIAEIQENSNLTYRLYDYNRIGKNGKKRELHIEKVLDVVKLESSEIPKQPLRVLKYKKGCATEFLCRCRYFQVERMLINTERCRELTSFQTDNNSFQVLLCINGCGVLLFEDSQVLHFFKGDCIFVPADSVLIKIHGKAELLKVTC